MSLLSQLQCFLVWTADNKYQSRWHSWLEWTALEEMNGGLIPRLRFTLPLSLFHCLLPLITPILFLSSLILSQFQLSKESVKINKPKLHRWMKRTAWVRKVCSLSPRVQLTHSLALTYVLSKSTAIILVWTAYKKNNSRKQSWIERMAMELKNGGSIPRVWFIFPLSLQYLLPSHS